jgi:hypothetical protein
MHPHWVERKAMTFQVGVKYVDSAISDQDKGR